GVQTCALPIYRKAQFEEKARQVTNFIRANHTARCEQHIHDTRRRIMRSRILLRRLFRTLIATSMILPIILRLDFAAAQTWVPLGPGPNTGGQVEGIANNEVVGAVNALALHPADKKIAYIGSVNGG